MLLTSHPPSHARHVRKAPATGSEAGVRLEAGQNSVGCKIDLLFDRSELKLDLYVNRLVGQICRNETRYSIDRFKDSFFV